MVWRNMSWIKYPSHDLLNPLISIEDIIASQNIISRILQCYVAFFLLPGLIAGLLILAIFFRNYSRHKRLERSDILMIDLVTTDIVIALFSFTAVVRPGYLEVTNLGCGFLSFFFNIIYFNSQYIQVLMLFILLLQRNQSRASLVTEANSLLLVSLTLALACLGSLLTVALLGTVAYLDETIYCQIDPLNAWPEYDIVTFSFGFAIPSLCALLFLVLIVIKLVKTGLPHLTENKPSPTIMLCIVLTMLTCRLFYNIMLLRRTALKLQRLNGLLRDELIMNTAEFILFGESCISLLFVLFLYKPCKDTVWSTVRHLRQTCQRKETTNSSTSRPTIELEEVEDRSVAVCSNTSHAT